MWHALAKLRIHTDKTLDLLEAATKTLTSAMRRFLRETCKAFHTKELRREAEARGRRAAALTSKGDSRTVKKKAKTVQRSKKFNLATYKYHALADYAEAIRRFGPTDNYSTQIVRILAYPTHFH